MPRPEEVVVDAGQGAPYGAQAAIQRLAATSPLGEPAAPAQASPPAMVTPPEHVDPSLAMRGDLNGGLDSVLFGPSARPHEPITAGVPVGPGASFIPQPFESDQEFLGRVAQEIDSSPAATDEAKAFALRIQRGE